jgi:hypothetical protein
MEVRAMSIQLQMEQMPSYLAARFIGAGEAEEVWRQFESISEYCKHTMNNKLLIDYTGAKLNISIVDRFYVGTESRFFSDNGVKVANFGTSEQIDPQRFGELVARNRGIEARAFTDFQAAEKWLLE